MIYDFDTIPAKLFYKISETGNLDLLCTEKCTDEELKKAWIDILDKNDKYDNTKSSKKVVDILKKVESLKAKYEAIRLAVHCLKRKVDDELIDLLKNYGYKFKWNEKEYSLGNLTQYQKDLEQIEKESEVIIFKIKELEEKLPKQKEEGKVPIDEVILGYAVILGMGFIDTNKITLVQHYTNIKLGNEKIKNIEKVTKKNRKR